MKAAEAKEHPILKKVVRELAETMGSRLRSVVLYGSAARGDFYEKTSDFNLILVLEDLDPPALEALSPVIHRWRRRGQPIPRLFSPSLIAASVDVFPIEFLDILACRVVLHGEDSFGSVRVGRNFLRIQCERELRTKLMRLREGYIEARGRAGDLRRLLTDSYTTFVALFRGCLHLLGGEVPLHNVEVVAAFCARAGLDRAPFEEVDRLKRGEGAAGELKSLFARYYQELNRAVGAVDRFDPTLGGETR